jgi:hypothetical protein
MGGRRKRKYLVDECLKLFLRKLFNPSMVQRKVSGSIEWRLDGSVIGSIGFVIRESVIEISYRVSEPSGAIIIRDSIPFCVRSNEVRETIYRCPRCGRYVYKLFLPPDERHFRCVNCHRLTYRSKQQHDKRIDALKKDPKGLVNILDALYSGKLPLNSTIGRLALKTYYQILSH